MENHVSQYKTVLKASGPILYKDRKSKFYAYTFPLAEEKEVKPIIESLRKKHATANHVCYAWRIGVNKQRYRANDDGEPNNSAGIPIYGQIKSFELTNILIAVVRIFGGSKLGLGGLISAYRTAAQLALESSPIIEKTVKVNYQLSFNYPRLSKVMRVIKQNPVKIINQDMSIDCILIVSVNINDATEVKNQLKSINGVSIVKLNR
jgi:uncharacterized YigZ family protein